MSFAYPGFLWALASLAIPVIIHLFNFRRTRKVFFSNTRLLKQVKEETTKKRKIKHWLILLCRLLFLLFLVLAFAQPFLPASEQFSGGRNVALYIDNSFSMSAPLADKTRALDAASGFATEILNTFPADTRYQLITNELAPFSNTFKTKGEVLELLSQLRLSGQLRSFEEIAKKIPTQGNPDVFFISDFQKATIGNLTPDTARQWRFVPVPVLPTKNVFIDTAWFDNPYLTSLDKNKLHVWLRNDGAETVEHLAVKLTLNGVLAATATLTVEGNSTVATEFDLTGAARQYQEIKISLQDFPISFDNDFYLAVNPTELLKVVEVKGSGTQPFVRNVYANAAVFNYRQFPETNIDFSVVEAADLVVLNGLNTIDPNLISLVRAGRIKSFLVVPSEKPDVKSYRALLQLPVAVTAKVSTQEKLAVPDFKNPFFDNVFEERSPALEMPVARPLLEWGTDPSAVLRWRDGTPVLSKTTGGYVLAMPLLGAYTDFMQHALFVPVMYKMAALGKSDFNRPYFLLSESVLTIASDTLAPDQPVRVTGATEVMPAQRFGGGKIRLEMPKMAMNAGFSYLLNGTDTLSLLAFNLTKNESLMATMTAQEIKSRIGEGKHVSVFSPSDRQAFSIGLKERYLGEPLWKYCVLLALLFVVAEIMLIRFLK